jgi:hypothetical protein
MKRDTPWKHAPWSPRDWQAEALPRAKRAIESGSPVVRAVTGAGKSILLAELAWLTEGRVVVTTPTTSLVDQLAETMRVRGMHVGRYFTNAKNTARRVIVCCNDSFPSLSNKIDPPELVIFDEAHGTECDTILDTLLGPKNLEGERQEHLGWMPAKRIGFTATPYRAEQSEALSLFDSLAYNYGPARAIKDGVVVPPRVVHYHGTATTLNEQCIEMIQGAEGPGIVDAINITDAKEFATELGNAGVRAQAIHSRQGDHTQERLLRQLEHGDLDCLVHVSLLSEGVDLPWLRWLCCRRPIGSRVLFAQYIGRGLRTYEGKDYCTVFDPQDLFGQLSLDYEAILGGDIEDDSDEDIPELPALEIDWAIDEIRDSEALQQETLRGVPVRVIDPTVSYVRRFRLSLQSMGMVSMQIGDREWRSEAPTQHQLKFIQRWDAGGSEHWRLSEPDIPASHQKALKVAVRAAPGVDRGAASDLISVLKTLEYGWPEQAAEEVAA